jgi:hypothetical protein
VQHGTVAFVLSIPRLPGVASNVHRPGRMLRDGFPKRKPASKSRGSLQSYPILLDEIPTFVTQSSGSHKHVSAVSAAAPFPPTVFVPLAQRGRGPWGLGALPPQSKVGRVCGLIPAGGLQPHWQLHFRSAGPKVGPARMTSLQ